MLNTLKKPINLVFLIQILVVFLVAFGLLPRYSALGLAALVSVFVLWADLETSTAFFVRSIPVFVAIPFASYFDSFNIWRILSGLIFLKWFFGQNKITDVKIAFKKVAQKINFREYPFSFFFVVWIVFSGLSLLVAPDLFAGLKRLIYISNLVLIGFVIYDLVKKNSAFVQTLARNILISGLIVAGVALVQLISAYLVSIEAFLDFWGSTVQLGFYGSQWATIVVEANTWFAYFGDQLSLRLFSTFPDSHSFPFYLLMTVPALLSFALLKVFREKVSFKGLLKKRASWLIMLLPVFYFLAILSGTRGIWLAVLGPIVCLPFLLKLCCKGHPRSCEGDPYNRDILKYLGSFFVIFFLLFLIAYPILGSDQFGLKKSDNQILAKRIRSILDLEETSNLGRIAIWKATVKSIIHNPLLGVGLGNFPVVLSQDPEYAKAGSSAHNLYLHIAAEVGLLGFAGAMGMLWLILKRGLDIFKISEDVFIKIYSVSFVLYALWVLFYSLTDAVLFDERAFLIFTINSTIILGLYKNKAQHSLGQ